MDTHFRDSAATPFLGEGSYGNYLSDKENWRCPRSLRAPTTNRPCSPENKDDPTELCSA